MNETARRMYAVKTAGPKTTIRIGVGVFVLDEKGRILMEKRSDSSMWGLLGGRVEPGESVIQAAKREVAEESGFEIEVTRLVGVFSEPSERIVTYPDNGDEVHLVDVILEARIVGGEMKISHESEELRFFAKDSPPEEIALPAVAPIRTYLEGKTGVVS